jgi:sugar phosphate isomerase/epimerase
MANTNDGSVRRPRLRSYLNLMSLEELPVAREEDALFEEILRAGYEGVQLVEPATAGQLALCARLGLGKCGLGRVNEAGEAGALAARFQDEGLECASLHVGWGMEDDDEAQRLIEAVLDASLRYKVPLYVETHRATIFQDMWRSVQFVRRFPELRFNGDFSHWYTGQEMVYGGFEKKLEFIAPVLERVRFMHGRIGNPGCIQVDVGDGDVGAHPYVGHFRAMWTAAFSGFLASAVAGDYFLFVPELLSARIYYARLLSGAGREEESDRWEQSLVLRRIAGECFERALVSSPA